MAISKAYFEDASSNPVSSYNYGDDLAIRVRDFSLNLNSSLAETVQATVTNSANADSETFTLTETATNDGIFELKNIKTSTDQPSVSGNSKIEIVVGTNTFQLTYANVYDAGDTSMATATIIVPSPSPSPLVELSILPQTGCEEVKFPIFYIVFSVILLTMIYSNDIFSCKE